MVYRVRTLQGAEFMAPNVSDLAERYRRHLKNFPSDTILVSRTCGPRYLLWPLSKQRLFDAAVAK